MARPKKTRTIPEQTTRRGPLKIRKEALIVAMRRLITNEDFGLLRSLWLGVRGEMLETGKAKPSEAQWSKLAGFDAAIMEPEKWAQMETVEDQHKQRSAELSANLAGTREER